MIRISSAFFCGVGEIGPVVEEAEEVQVVGNVFLDSVFPGGRHTLTPGTVDDVTKDNDRTAFAQPLPLSHHRRIVLHGTDQVTEDGHGRPDVAVQVADRIHRVELVRIDVPFFSGVQWW